MLKRRLRSTARTADRLGGHQRLDQAVVVDGVGQMMLFDGEAHLRPARAHGGDRRQGQALGQFAGGGDGGGAAGVGDDAIGAMDTEEAGTIALDDDPHRFGDDAGGGAERDGIVKKISAKPGDSLPVDAVILEFE